MSPKWRCRAHNWVSSHYRDREDVTYERVDHVVVPRRLAHSRTCKLCGRVERRETAPGQIRWRVVFKGD